MKLTRILAAAAISAAFAFAACTSGTVHHASNCQPSPMFGNISEVYQQGMTIGMEAAHDAIKADKNIPSRSMRDSVFAIAADMAKQVTPLCNELVGHKIAFTIDSGVPYGIRPDITVVSVEPPYMAENGRHGVQLNVEVTLENASPTADAGLFYLIMADTVPMGNGTMHFQANGKRVITAVQPIFAPNLPANYVAECNSLRFVTSADYDEAIQQIALLSNKK